MRKYIEKTINDYQTGALDVISLTPEKLE